MLRTRVGYCGGQKANPTYYELGDHTEAIAIDFDPTVISYEDLLQRFWDGHYCASNVGMTQYRNAVFYHNDTQKKLAEASRAKAAAKAGIEAGQVQTALLPVGTFSYAEGYHQKYALTGHRELRAFLNETYPDGKSLADSTVATRLNAWLGSGITREFKNLETEAESYGLPDKLKDYVLEKARARTP